MSSSLLRVLTRNSAMMLCENNTRPTASPRRHATRESTTSPSHRSSPSSSHSISTQNTSPTVHTVTAVSPTTSPSPALWEPSTTRRPATSNMSVPERWPENWYRRSTSYDAVEALVDGFTRICPANPVAMPVGQIGTPNLNASTLLCSVSPPSRLSPSLVNPKPLRRVPRACLASLSISVSMAPLLVVQRTPSLRTFLYPNATTAGGPIGPSLDRVSKNGNNVYYKIYHTEAPKHPKCSYLNDPQTPETQPPTDGDCPAQPYDN